MLYVLTSLFIYFDDCHHVGDLKVGKEDKKGKQRMMMMMM